MTRTPLGIIVLLLALAGCSRAGCGPSHERPDGAVERRGADEPLPLESTLDEGEWEVIDPYCGMRLRRAEAAATFEYEGRTYYFCMTDHRDAFARDPARYLASLEADAAAADTPDAAAPSPDAAAPSPDAAAPSPDAAAAADAP